jgi:hypothetical protein
MGADTKQKKNPLNKKQEKLLQEIHQAVQDMVDELHENPPPTREFALMLTKLEEAEMWGQRGFEILGYAPDEDEGEEGEEGEEAEEGDDAGEEEE